MKGFKVKYSSVILRCSCGNEYIYKYLIPDATEVDLTKLTTEEIDSRVYFETTICNTCGNNINIPRLK